MLKVFILVFTLDTGMQGYHNRIFKTPEACVNYTIKHYNHLKDRFQKISPAGTKIKSMRCLAFYGQETILAPQKHRL